MGTSFQSFLSEQLKGKLTSLPGQSFATLLLSGCWHEWWMLFWVWDTTPTRRWLHSRLTAFHAVGSALGTCLVWQSYVLGWEGWAGSPHSPFLPVSLQSILWWGSFWPDERCVVGRSPAWCCLGGCSPQQGWEQDLLLTWTLILSLLIMQSRAFFQDSSPGTGMAP